MVPSASCLDDTLDGTAAQATVLTTSQMIQGNQVTFLILYALFHSVVAIRPVQRARHGRPRAAPRDRHPAFDGRHRAVAQVFWTEGVGLALVSWLIAVAIGIPAAYVFLQFVGAALLAVPFAFNPGQHPGYAGLHRGGGFSRHRGPGLVRFEDQDRRDAPLRVSPLPEGRPGLPSGFTPDSRSCSR